MLFPTGWTGGLYWIWQPMEKRLIKISSAWQLNGGIRLPVFYTPKVGELKQKCYIIPEPRAELFYFPGTGNRLHAAFTQSSQNLHMLSNSSVGIPSDMWIPANGQLKPAVMKQVALGI